MPTMDELRIAELLADVLRGEGADRGISDNWFGSSDPRFFSRKWGKEEEQIGNLYLMAFQLAFSRATQSGLDVKLVLREVRRDVTAHARRILAADVLDGLTKVLIEDDWEVCAVCQEQMDVGDEVRAMGCLHKFHEPCILQWLMKKRNCPICRYQREN